MAKCDLLLNSLLSSYVVFPATRSLKNPNFPYPPFTEFKPLSRFFLTPIFLNIGQIDYLR